MPPTDRQRLRVTFDQAAELYDRVRPGYPPALFDDLTELAGIGPGCRLLEIGPGTGQVTLPLAERGCQIVAVELGAELAAVARRNLARFPHVQIVTAGFEDWPLPTEPFDVVLAATAFHWIDPAVRVSKAADALRPGGMLAIIATHHIAGGDEAFFAEVQGCYERWDPKTPPSLRLPTAADPYLQRRAGPLGPLRPRKLPPLRVGAVLLDRRLPGRAAHLLRPPRDGPHGTSQPA
jgi:SAM-dependent methyltransferase